MLRKKMEAKISWGEGGKNLFFYNSMITSSHWHWRWLDVFLFLTKYLGTGHL